MLVGGGFCVFDYAVVSGGLRWFTGSHVVELHGRFRGLKRRKGPPPTRGRGRGLEVVF
nr:MAG TPA: hypothetical protein [Caudoviricetes sp.]